MKLVLFSNVGELSTNDKVTVDGFTTTPYDVAIAVGGDVLNYVAGTVNSVDDTNRSHCNKLHRLSQLVLHYR